MCAGWYTTLQHTLLVHTPVSQSISQSVSQPAGQSVSQPVSCPTQPVPAYFTVCCAVPRAGWVDTLIRPLLRRRSTAQCEPIRRHHLLFPPTTALSAISDIYLRLLDSTICRALTPNCVLYHRLRAEQRCGPSAGRNIHVAVPAHAALFSFLFSLVRLLFCFCAFPSLPLLPPCIFFSLFCFVCLCVCVWVLFFVFLFITRRSFPYN